MKHFDRIDIIFTVLISIYLITLFVAILWLVLNKIEKNYWLPKKNVTPVVEKKNAVKKQANTKTTNNKNVTPKKQTSIKKATNPQTKKVASKAATKTTTNTNKNKTTTVKKQPNNSKRKTGYVSPTKRKKTNKRKKRHLRNSLNVFFCFFNYIYRAMFCF